jgi:hypothetical protein
MAGTTDWATWAAAQLGWFVPLALTGLLAMACGLFATHRRLKILERHYRTLTAGVDARDLMDTLEHHLSRLTAAEARLSAADSRLTAAEQQARWALQDFGLVRFDAFDDVGGKVSFAVALLDDQGEGLVVSSLFGRDGSSTYAKRVGPNAHEVELSVEERDALEVARQRAAARSRARRTVAGL